MRQFNIEKYAGGGLFIGRNYYKSSLVPPTGQAPSQEAPTEERPKVLSENIKTKLMQNGLTNEVYDFYRDVEAFESTSSFSPSGFDKKTYYKLQAKAAELFNNFKWMEEAENRIKSNNALEDYAIDENGFMYVRNASGDVSKVHASKVNHNKQQPLTYSQLIEYRKFDPHSVYNQDIITTVGSGTGVEKANDWIWKIVDKIGSSKTTSEAFQALTTILGQQLPKKPTVEDLAAIQQLAEITSTIGATAVFKEKNMSKDQIAQMNHAMKYIFSMLPKNMKNALIAHHVGNGGSYSSANQNMYDIFFSAMNAARDNEYEHSADFDASLTKAAGAKDEEELKQKRNMTSLQQLTQGSLGQTTLNITSDKMPEYNLQLHGTGMGYLADANNNRITKTPATVALNGGLGGVIDKTRIYAGNQKITENTLDSIVYDGNEVVNVWVPTTPNGEIDFDRLTQFEAIVDRIKKSPVPLTSEEQQTLLHNNGFSGYIDNNGNYQAGAGDNMSQYIVFTGITSSKIVDDDSNIYLNELKGPEKKEEEAAIARVYAQYNSKLKDKDAHLNFKEGWFSNLYRVPIFMKLTSTAPVDVNTLVNQGPLISTPTYGQAVAWDQAQNGNLVMPSTNLILQ